MASDPELSNPSGSSDTPFWSAPDALHADDLVAPQPTGDLVDGGSYAGIPQALNGRFSEHADAPAPSVPPALAPSPQVLPVQAPPLTPQKDND